VSAHGTSPLQLQVCISAQAESHPRICSKGYCPSAAVLHAAPCLAASKYYARCLLVGLDLCFVVAYCFTHSDSSVAEAVEVLSMSQSHPPVHVAGMTAPQPSGVSRAHSRSDTTSLNPYTKSIMPAHGAWRAGGGGRRPPPPPDDEEARLEVWTRGCTLLVGAVGCAATFTLLKRRDLPEDFVAQIKQRIGALAPGPMEPAASESAVRGACAPRCCAHVRQCENWFIIAADIWYYAGCPCRSFCISNSCKLHLVGYHGAAHSISGFRWAHVHSSGGQQATGRPAVCTKDFDPDMLAHRWRLHVVVEFVTTREPFG
jgi:hypothetical protein